MNAIVKFGDCFNWEAHDDYVDYVDYVNEDSVYKTVDDPSGVAMYINAILSDEAKKKQYNFKDHGDVNGIWLYTFMTDEYIFICHYTYSDEDQAYLFRHQNMS